MIADIDAARNDLAAHTERQVGLHPRLHITGQGDPGGEVGRLYLLHAYAWQCFGGFFLTTARQQGHKPQADDQQRTYQRHAGSLLARK
ncbi:hypothetical protein D3C77_704220 [compost metagenome]